MMLQVHVENSVQNPPSHQSLELAALVMLDGEGGMEVLDTLPKEATMVINLEPQQSDPNKRKCLVCYRFINDSSLLPPFPPCMVQRRDGDRGQRRPRG